MKTKELLHYLDTNNLTYLTKLKELELSKLKLIEVFNYYDGDLNGIVEINNNNNWQELFSRDLDILGYFIN